MGRTLRPLGPLTALTSAALALSLSACGSAEQTTIGKSASAYSLAPTASPHAPSSAAVPAPARRHSARKRKAHVRVVRTVAKHIRVPWGITELPDGEVLVGSRDTGKVYRLDVRAGTRTAVGRVAGAVSNVAAGGEAGLLGLAVSPRFATDHRVYVYFSTRGDNRIGWMTYAGGHLGRPHVILSGIPHGVHHDGGRIAFGPDGLLYAGTGETMVKSLAQKKSSLGGKVLRMTRAGRPAPGNPFGSLVYTYGHRNVEGLTFDPAGRLWASELGDHDVDELNLIRAGHDYGWPATQGKTANPKYTSPVAQWGTSTDSPSGIAYAHGAIWMAALHGERLWRIPIHGAHAGKPRAFLVRRYGRLRSVLALGPHRLLVTTSNRDGRARARRGDDRVLLLKVR
jgi:glucose/arabinose dehydrogenase